eukprot:tig00020675_g12634.t1
MVLKWSKEETRAWLAERFALTADDPAYRALRRLRLSGRLLLLHPARFFEARLLGSLNSKPGDREEDDDEVEALKTVLGSLDSFVALLVEEAREGALDGRGRQEVDRLFGARLEAIAAADGAGPGQQA